MANTRSVRIALSLPAMAVVVSMVGLTPASAQTTEVTPRGSAPVSAPTTASLTLNRPGGEVSTALAAECYGQTDYPHFSTHVAGRANVQSRTVCTGRGVYVSTSLYRDRWYGQQFLSSNSGSGFGSVETNTNWGCAGTGTYTYRAYSYHEASDGSSANTANSNRFAC